MVSIIPLRCLYLLSSLTYVVLYYVFGYRKTVVRPNLQNSFPDKSLTEIIEIEKRFYKHFCDVAFESVKALTISKRSISKRFHIKNLAMVEELYDQKKDVIMYTSHYGNWEWIAFLPLFLPHHVTAFYQQLSNRYFDQLMMQIRSRFGVQCIESRNGYRALIKLKQEKVLSFNCIIGDQSPRMDVAKHWVTFLNQETAFLTGADKIAKKTNQIVIFPLFRKLKRGRYELEFIVIEENAQLQESQIIIEKYAEILENTITKSPELWLWTHRRWKLTKPNK